MCVCSGVVKWAYRCQLHTSFPLSLSLWRPQLCHAGWRLGLSAWGRDWSDSPDSSSLPHSLSTNVRGQLHLLLLHFDGRLSEFEHIIKLDCTYRHGQALLLCPCPPRLRPALSSSCWGCLFIGMSNEMLARRHFPHCFAFLFKICSSTTSSARSRTRGGTGAARWEGGGEGGGAEARPVQVAWRCPWQLTHFDPLAPGAWQLQLFGIGATFTYLIKRLHSALPLAPIPSLLHPDSQQINEKLIHLQHPQTADFLLRFLAAHPAACKAQNASAECNVVI